LPFFCIRSRVNRVAIGFAWDKNNLQNQKYPIFDTTMSRNYKFYDYQTCNLMEDLKPLTVKGTGSFNLEASFKGQNALTFMKNMGYEFNSVGSSGGGTPWYSIYNWPALGSSARIMDALYTGNYLNVGIQFVTCAAEVFTFGNVLELNLAAKGVRL